MNRKLFKCSSMLAEDKQYHNKALSLNGLIYVNYNNKLPTDLIESQIDDFSQQIKIMLRESIRNEV